ncbi:MAG: hypothetical protein EOP45_08225 [Sphingobacteriaceae bacterium]|nr:MAG: hypothetical protein EOP45_08225 [Sphingobacteriaceae bacterium]
MKADDYDKKNAHFDSDIVWDAEHLAQLYEQQSRLLRNLEQDQVVNSLKRVLKALETRDYTRYCFVLSGETLLTSDGFRVRTGDKEGLQTWAYKGERSCDMTCTYKKIMQDIKQIVSQDPDKIKKRLGANLYLRDYFDNDCICCLPPPSGDCHMAEGMLCCPLVWPCCIPITIVSSILQLCFGTAYGDPRKL